VQRCILVFVLFVLAATPGISQKKKTKAKNPTVSAPAPAPPTPPPAKADDGSAALERVLSEMDASAAAFRSAEADFVWEQYQSVVQETDVQKGKVFFVRHEKDTHMAADISVPDKKYLVFTEGKIRFYQPRIDQLTEYDANKNKSEVESFLVLGFGGRGHDLPKSFAVRLLGTEVVDGIKTAKLELVPRSERVRNSFERFILWVDTARDISLKQQAFEPSGDYRTAYYSNIKLNDKLADDVFKLKTTPKTKVVKQ
jgi:outer membrane lipoprotein-sorting protein